MCGASIQPAWTHIASTSESSVYTSVPQSWRDSKLRWPQNFQAARSSVGSSSECTGSGGSEEDGSCSAGTVRRTRLCMRSCARRSFHACVSRISRLMRACSNPRQPSRQRPRNSSEGGIYEDARSRASVGAMPWSASRAIRSFTSACSLASSRRHSSSVIPRPMERPLIRTSIVAPILLTSNSVGIDEAPVGSYRIEPKCRTARPRSTPRPKRGKFFGCAPASPRCSMRLISSICSQWSKNCHTGSLSTRGPLASSRSLCSKGDMGANSVCVSAAWTCSSIAGAGCVSSLAGGVTRWWWWWWWWCGAWGW